MSGCSWATIEAAVEDKPVAPVSGTGQRFAVLYGSSLGTAREIAEEIAARAAVDGFETVVRSMDESLASGNLPEDRVIVDRHRHLQRPRARHARSRSSARSTPAQFDGDEWTGAKFAVLGIGNSQWPNYQAFPKRIDAALEATGASRLMPRAEADGLGDFDGAVAGFVRDLWKALGSEAEPSAGDLDAVAATDRRRRRPAPPRCPNMRSSWRSSPTTRW